MNTTVLSGTKSSNPTQEGELTAKRWRSFHDLRKASNFANIAIGVSQAFEDDITLPGVWGWKIHPLSDFSSLSALTAEAGSFPAQFFGAKQLLHWAQTRRNPNLFPCVAALGCSRGVGDETQFLVLKYQPNGLSSLAFTPANILLALPTYYIRAQLRG